MACGAIDLISNVGLMLEFHVVRNIENPHPWHGCLRIEMPSFLHNLGVLGNDISVAEEALGHRRNPSILRAVDKRVTESATDFLVTGMDPMAEIDRLPGSDGS